MSQRPLSWAKPTKVATHVLSPPIAPTTPGHRACTPLALKQSAAHYVGNDQHFCNADAQEQDSHISVKSQFEETNNTNPMMLSGQSTTEQEGPLQVSFTGFNAQSIAANCKHTIKWSLVRVVDKIGLQDMKELIINFGTICWKLAFGYHGNNKEWKDIYQAVSRNNAKISDIRIEGNLFVFILAEKVIFGMSPEAKQGAKVEKPAPNGSPEPKATTHGAATTPRNIGRLVQVNPNKNITPRVQVGSPSPAMGSPLKANTNTPGKYSRPHNNTLFLPLYASSLNLSATALNTTTAENPYSVSYLKRGKAPDFRENAAGNTKGKQAASTIALSTNERREKNVAEEVMIIHALLSMHIPEVVLLGTFEEYESTDRFGAGNATLLSQALRVGENLQLRLALGVKGGEIATDEITLPGTPVTVEELYKDMPHYTLVDPGPVEPLFFAKAPVRLWHSKCWRPAQFIRHRPKKKREVVPTTKPVAIVMNLRKINPVGPRSAVVPAKMFASTVKPVKAPTSPPPHATTAQNKAKSNKAPTFAMQTSFGTATDLPHTGRSHARQQLAVPMPVTPLRQKPQATALPRTPYPKPSNSRDVKGRGIFSGRPTPPRKVAGAKAANQRALQLPLPVTVPTSPLKSRKAVRPPMTPSVIADVPPLRDLSKLQPVAKTSALIVPPKRRNKKEEALAGTAVRAPTAAKATTSTALPRQAKTGGGPKQQSKVVAKPEQKLKAKGQGSRANMTSKRITPKAAPYAKQHGKVAPGPAPTTRAPTRTAKPPTESQRQPPSATARNENVRGANPSLLPRPTWNIPIYNLQRPI